MFARGEILADQQPRICGAEGPVQGLFHETAAVYDLSVIGVDGNTVLNRNTSPDEASRSDVDIPPFAGFSLRLTHIRVLASS